MPLNFRDVLASAEARDEKFKRRTSVFPCITCDALGVIEDASGNPISAVVAGQPDYVWVMAYGDSTPFTVLNDNKINPQTGVLVYVGYLEDSSKQEIIGLNNSVLGLAVDTGVWSPFAGTFSYITRDLFPILKTTPASAGGVAVDVSALEYDRFGGREVSFATSLSLSSSVPSAGLIRWVLVYLDGTTGTVQSLDGVAIPNLASASPIKPDTPVDGIASSYVKLASGATGIATGDIAEAKRITTPNTIPGLVYNRAVRPITIPADYSMVRGPLQIEAGQTVAIEDGGRIVLL